MEYQKSRKGVKVAASKKNIAKSVRISEEVFSYIDKAPGKGFNEKFENIILEAKRTEADRKIRLAYLEQQIATSQKKLSRLLEQQQEFQKIFRMSLTIQHQLIDMKGAIDRAINESEDEQNND